ncbi:MAG: NusG domain II-containing protein [candidate division KSB1 bacterium]|jgi:hypothetical protein|nr:NusG domain II-containing protein [candidate division KSB1 bacterium]
MKEWIRLLTKGDMFLILAMIVLSVASLVIIRRSQTSGRSAVITVDGIERERLALSRDRELTVSGPIGETVVKVEDNRIRVLHSDCAAKVCVKTGQIHLNGQMIVCVPNKVVISITAYHQRSIDVVTE